jgi:hypothetical protein
MRGSYQKAATNVDQFLETISRTKQVQAVMLKRATFTT